MTPEEMALLQAARIRAGQGNVRDLIGQGANISNLALEQAFKAPDTSGLEKVGRDTQRTGFEQMAGGMFMAPSEAYRQMGQTSFGEGIKKQGSQELGEGWYSGGTYTANPFKRQDRLTKALGDQAGDAGKVAESFGKEDTAVAQRGASRASAAASYAQAAKARQEMEQGKYGTMKDESGSDILYQITPQGVKFHGGPGAAAGAGGADAGGLPKYKLNDAQGKAMNYGARTAEAAAILDSLGTNYSSLSVATKGGLQDLPGVGGIAGMAYNQFMGKNEQRVEQAQRNFINAVLRRESGAVISVPEFDNARHQYFPQPGDDEAVLAQKKHNRDMVIRNFAIESGPGRAEVMRVMQRGAPQGAGGGGAPAWQDDLNKYRRPRG
jgi:hypothetical protein